MSKDVPEISLDLNCSDNVNLIDECNRNELLQPVVKNNSLRLSDNSNLAGSNRRSFVSWGYEFELGNDKEDLSNDSIDMGESGRINFRTGSFMTRYRRNSKASSNPRSPKSSLTTQKSECNNWALCHDGSGHCGSVNIEDELDPVLDCLISDMDSLDNFRHIMYNRTSLHIPNDLNSTKMSSPRRLCKSPPLNADTSTLLNPNSMDNINPERQESLEFCPTPVSTIQNKKLSVKKSSSTRRRNHPFRWSSLARSNQPGDSNNDMDLSHFSINQFLILKKLAMLRLTSVLEKYIPSQRSTFHWKFPKLLSTRLKPPDNTAEVFGVTLSYWQSKIGQPLPPVIYHALKYIRQIGPESDGIFRRAGGRARINELKKEIEKNPDLLDFSSWQSYDVADMIKSFFRSLPECLMTNKFSTTLISIITYVPDQQWLETIQWGIINLPDENRLVLQNLLYFLSDLAKHSEKTKMTSINLAVCLSPSLFHSPHSIVPLVASPIRMRKSTHGPDPRDLASQKAAHICLKYMIDNANSLFRISEETVTKAHIQLELERSVSLSKLLRGCNDWFGWIRERVDNIMGEYHHKFKYWTSIRKDIFKYHQEHNQVCQGFELFYKKSGPSTDNPSENGNGIGTWKITADIEAPASVIIEKILYMRHEWDPEIRSLSIKKEISDSVDICHMESVSNPPQYNRDMTLIRGCQRNIDSHISVIVSQSVDDQLTRPDEYHPLLQRSINIQERPSTTIPINVIQDDVIIEYMSSVHRSRIHWLSRVDLRGLSSDWYFRQWSHVLIRRLIHLKLSLLRS